MLGSALLALSAWGQDMKGAVAPGATSPPADARPPGLTNVGIEQRLNQQVPLDLAFRDENGKSVCLRDYFGQKPVVLSLVYYKCPMLCSEVLSGLTNSLKILKFDIGDQFNVLTVSFNPEETPELAAAAKAGYLKRYNRPGAAEGWHFLTGRQESIARLTDAVGFQYQYDARSGQYAHATAIMVLTPEGRVAQYYYGVDYAPRDLRLALVQASKHRIGTLVDSVLLYCYHYDPAIGKYGAVITRILKLSGIATILVLGGLVLVLFRRGSVHPGQEQNRSQRYV
jgi:protein SCO1/2